MVSIDSLPPNFSVVRDASLIRSIDPTELSVVQCTKCLMMLRKSLLKTHLCIIESQKFFDIDFKKKPNQMFLCPICNRQLYKMQIQSHLEAHPDELKQRLIEMQNPSALKIAGPSQQKASTVHEMIANRFMESYRKRMQEIKLDTERTLELPTQPKQKAAVTSRASAVSSTSDSVPASLSILNSVNLPSGYRAQAAQLSDSASISDASGVSLSNTEKRSGASSAVSPSLKDAVCQDQTKNKGSLSTIRPDSTSPVRSSHIDKLNEALAFAISRKPPTSSPSPFSKDSQLKANLHRPQCNQPSSQSTAPPSVIPAPQKTTTESFDNLEGRKKSSEASELPRKRPREFTVKECIRKVRKTEYGIARLEEVHTRCNLLNKKRYYNRLKNLINS